MGPINGEAGEPRLRRGSKVVYARQPPGNRRIHVIISIDKEAGTCMLQCFDRRIPHPVPLGKLIPAPEPPRRAT